MFCIECGSKLGAGVRFCENCGKAVGETNIVNEVPVINEVKIEESKPIITSENINNDESNLENTKVPRNEQTTSNAKTESKEINFIKRHKVKFIIGAAVLVLAVVATIVGIFAVNNLNKSSIVGKWSVYENGEYVEVEFTKEGKMLIENREDNYTLMINYLVEKTPYDESVIIIKSDFEATGIETFAEVRFIDKNNIYISNTGMFDETNATRIK